MITHPFSQRMSTHRFITISALVNLLPREAKRLPALSLPGSTDNASREQKHIHTMHQENMFTLYYFPE